MNYADTDKDGKVSLWEYQEVVRKTLEQQGYRGVVDPNAQAL